MFDSFFDIYSSPIVRTWFSNLVDTKCYINWCHLPQTRLTINELATKLEINKSNSHRVYFSVTDNHRIVCFTFVGDIGSEVNLNFTVNYSFTRRNIPKVTKITIIKWLLEVWKLERANYSSYNAVPSGNKNPNRVDFREKYYSRFGFKWINNKQMRLI